MGFSHIHNFIYIYVLSIYLYITSLHLYYPFPSLPFYLHVSSLLHLPEDLPVVRQRPRELQVLPDQLAGRHVAGDGAELLDDADLWRGLAAKADEVAELESAGVFRQVVQQATSTEGVRQG